MKINYAIRHFWLILAVIVVVVVVMTIVVYS